MKKVFCNDLQPNTHIRVTNERGATEDYIVRKMIPMQSLQEDGFLGQVKDIEILLDKSKNTYFSYKMYLKDESWVKKIEILS
jgi:hypothetical protein